MEEQELRDELVSNLTTKQLEDAVIFFRNKKSKHDGEEVILLDIWARLDGDVFLLWIPLVQALGYKDWARVDDILNSGCSFLAMCGAASVAADLTQLGGYHA